MRYWKKYVNQQKSKELLFKARFCLLLQLIIIQMLLYLYSCIFIYCFVNTFIVSYHNLTEIKQNKNKYIILISFLDLLSMYSVTQITLVMSRIELMRPNTTKQQEIKANTKLRCYKMLYILHVLRCYIYYMYMYIIFSKHQYSNTLNDMTFTNNKGRIRLSGRVTFLKKGVHYSHFPK